MKYQFSFFCVSAFIILAGFPPFVFSQENISVDVSAEKIAKDVPLESASSIVITADDIAESGASSIVDILENVPGIMFRSPLAGPGSEQITMRGFGNNSHGKVLVLVDGTRLNNPDMSTINWNMVSLLDIERIEILDGASSVRYGNNAVAGVINIITKKSGKTQTNINLSGGSFWNNKEAISHQRSTNWGRFSLSAEHLGSEGYRDRSASDITNAALQGTIDFNDQLSLSLKGTFSHFFYQLPGAISETDYKDHPRTAQHKNDEATEYHVSGGAELEWFLTDNIELNLPLMYRGRFAENDIATSSLYPMFADRNLHTVEAHPIADFHFDIDDMLLNLILGMDFHFSDLNIQTFTANDRKTKSTNQTSNAFNSGYFLTANFIPFNRFSINAGARYDFITMGSKNENSFNQAFTYEAGAAFKPIDQLNLYAKYSSLFRFPFLDEAADTFSGSYFLDDLKPETGFTIEGGINFVFDNWISLNANIYFMKLDDEIDYDSVHWRNQNLDPTQRVGTNISLTSNPVSFLELHGAYSYVDAEFTDGINKGKAIPMVSAHEVSGVITFALPLKLKLGINLDYRSESFQAEDYSTYTEKKVDDYFLLGASISYTLDKNDYRLMILFQGKNLLDTIYSPFVSYGGYYPGNGREFNLSVQYRF